ncbi:MAG: T9SS type A sorting domain-containing protein [candidate division WOR-3 bacterium]
MHHTKIILSFLLLFVFCVYLDNVIQPSSVSIDQRFTITVNGTFDGTSDTLCGWLAMMLPLGVSVESIRYNTGNGFTELVRTTNDTIIENMRSSYPPDPNMDWLAFGTSPYQGITQSSYTATVYLFVTTASIPGSYLIDYRTGAFEREPGGYTIYYGDSILDQPLQITSGDIKETSPDFLPAYFSARSIGKEIELSFNLPKPTNVSLSLYSRSGERILSFQIFVPEGISHLKKDLSFLPSGIYFLKADLGERVVTRKHLILK